MDSQIIDRIVELKADGFKSLYYLNVKGLELIFRPLTFDEHNTIIDLERYLDGASINDTLLRMTVLSYHEANWIERYPFAFHIDYIAQIILEVSGFQNEERFLSILNEKRHLARQIHSLIEIYICTAFKTISPTQVKAMNLDEQIELFAKAEEALGKPIEFDKLFGEPKKDDLYPTPPGMESTNDLLSAEVADMPDWNERR